MSLIIYTLSCIGMTQILVYGKIFDNIRPTTGWWGKLLSCSMCTGFWTGVFLWAISPATELFMFDSSIVTAFVLGCYSSAVSYMGDMIVGDCGLQIKQTILHNKGDQNETVNQD